jgi:hypothetical protein
MLKYYRSEKKLAETFVTKKVSIVLRLFSETEEYGH